MRRYGVQAALLGVAAVWGWTFVVVADAIARYPMYAFPGLALRARERGVRGLLARACSPS